MSKFIEVTDTGGDKHLLNVDRIIRITPYSNYISIVSEEYRTVEAVGDYEELKKQIVGE